MGKSTDRTKWTMTYTPGTKYKLTCLNDNFSEREMSVKVPCGGKVMTDNLYVTVKAKQGDIAVSGNDISAILSLTYSTNEVSISEGKTTIKASVAEKGWVEAEETGEKTKQVGVSGSYTIPVQTGKTVSPTASGKTYYADSGKYLKSFSTLAVNTNKIRVEPSLIWDRYNYSDFTLYSYRVFISLIRHDANYCRVYVYNDSPNFTPNTSTSPKPSYVSSVEGSGRPGYWFGDINKGDVICGIRNESNIEWWLIHSGYSESTYNSEKKLFGTTSFSSTDVNIFAYFHLEKNNTPASGEHYALIDYDTYKYTVID